MQPTTRPRRRSTLGSQFAIMGIALAAAIGFLGWLGAWSFKTGQVTATVVDSAYFYRLTSKYMHGDEPVEFDIVVGCGVRVTLSAADGSSYDAFRDPLFYVQATRDGAAVLQIVPNACQGQTTDNGRVPADFLPGTIWFDSKDDFTFGIAYIAEDAFENPKAKLRFLGAAIHPATRAEWEAFKPINAKNLLSPRWFSRGPPTPPTEEIEVHLWDKKKIFQWRPYFSCHGVQRYRLSESAARAMLHERWPDSRPRFWMPPGNEREALEDRLKSMNHGQGPLVEGRYYREYFTSYLYRGFPTRSGGGTFLSAGVASTVFPYRQDDGVPWITPALANAPVIYRDVDLMNGDNVGRVYCYDFFRTGPITEAHLPNHSQRTFAVRVDGEHIEAEDFGPDFPWLFFENDEYMYFEFHFGLT